MKIVSGKLNHLSGRIRQIFGDQRAFAVALGKSPTYVSQRLCRRVDFTTVEIVQWCDLLQIQPFEITEYFFPWWMPKSRPLHTAKAKFSPERGIVCAAFTGKRSVL